MSTTMVNKAGDAVAYELSLFANTITEAEREHFFHPCNQDLWVERFCEWLVAKQRKSVEVRASND